MDSFFAKSSPEASEIVSQRKIRMIRWLTQKGHSPQETDKGRSVLSTVLFQRTRCIDDILKELTNGHEERSNFSNSSRIRSMM